MEARLERTVAEAQAIKASHAQESARLQAAVDNAQVLTARVRQLERKLETESVENGKVIDEIECKHRKLVASEVRIQAADLIP